MKILLYSFLLSILFISCKCSADKSVDSSQNNSVEAGPPVIICSVINTYPHDTTYFTEGLEMHQGQLFESSGGDDDASPYPSAFGIANLKTGKVDTKVVLDKSKHFGEGITFFKDKIYQLTWKSGVGYVYDAKTFKKLREFKMPTKEGWGLTHDSTNLIMSDGTNSLYFIHPDSLRIQNIVGVTDNNGPVSNVNELEYVNGYIYANQWLTPYILKIEPSSGKVVGRIDLSRLTKEMEDKYPGARELNGIAYNASNNSFFISGKKWPFVYEIRLQ